MKNLISTAIAATLVLASLAPALADDGREEFGGEIEELFEEFDEEFDELLEEFEEELEEDPDELGEKFWELFEEFAEEFDELAAEFEGAGPPIPVSANHEEAPGSTLEFRAAGAFLILTLTLLVTSEGDIEGTMEGTFRTVIDLNTLTNIFVGEAVFTGSVVGRTGSHIASFAGTGDLSGPGVFMFPMLMTRGSDEQQGITGVIHIDQIGAIATSEGRVHFDADDDDDDDD